MTHTWEEMTEAQRAECTRVSKENIAEAHKWLGGWKSRVGERADELEAAGNPKGAQLIRNETSGVVFLFGERPEPEEATKK